MRPEMARANTMMSDSPRVRSQNGQLTDEPSLGTLFGELSQKASILVRQEVQLAKAEIAQKIGKASKHVALIAGGGLLGYAGLLALVAALILGLSTWMDPWLAAFLVGALFVGIAAVLIVTGLNGLQEIDPVPQQTIATLKEDKEWLTRQMN